MTGPPTGLRRAFIAVVPPAPVLDAIERRVATARASEPGLRWTRRDQWHLTLRFLGPVADAGALVTTVRGALCGAAPVPVHLGGSGAFPNPTRATVVWMGVRAGLDELADLARALAQATAALGPVEARPFRPHLTLARLARPCDVASLVGTLGVDAVGSAWVANDVAVMESDTRPEGAVYREVARLPFGCAGAS